MKKTLIYTACVAALSSSSALAQSQKPLEGCVLTREHKATDIYFANGVGNTEDDAIGTRAYLRGFYTRLLKPFRERFGTFDFEYAYNPTLDTFYDVVEVLNQKSREQGFSEWLSGLQILRLIQGGLNSAEFRMLARIVLEPTSFIPGVDSNLDSLFRYASDEILKAQAEAIKKHT